MINQNELKLNNWVKYNGADYQIEGLSPEYPFLNSGVSFGVGVVDYNNIEPIKSTEELLLSMGFKYVNDVYDKKVWLKIKTKKRGISLEISLKLKRIILFNGRNVCDIRYNNTIHGIQNLVFDLTGEELNKIRQWELKDGQPRQLTGSWKKELQGIFQ